METILSSVRKPMVEIANGESESSSDVFGTRAEDVDSCSLVDTRRYLMKSSIPLTHPDRPCCHIACLSEHSEHAC